MWIYQPGLNIEAKRHKFAASQLDILPTIHDLLGFPDIFAAMRSYLYRERDNFSPIGKGNLFGGISKKGSFLMTGEKIILNDEESLSNKIILEAYE